MKTDDIDLSKLLEYRPLEGKVMLGAERMLIFRQQALSVLRGLMVRQLGDELSRALLSQFGYHCGRGDYQALMENFEWDTDMDTLASGPVLHTWEGIVHAAPDLIDYDRETGHFHMSGTWTNSYEAEIHLETLGPSETPVCHSLTGYASGWASAFFGAEVLCIEPMCVAKGDPHCRFELRNIDAWKGEGDWWREALQTTSKSLVRELESKLEIIGEQQRVLEDLNSRQQHAISELSTPILEIWDDILVLPIVGIVDSARSMEIMDKLLRAIANSQARAVILDITGVEALDDQTANELLRVVQAAGLLGAHCVVTGVSPAVARLMVQTGVDLSSVQTLKNLKQGLRACMRLLEGDS